MPTEFKAEYYTQASSHATVKCYHKSSNRSPRLLLIHPHYSEPMASCRRSMDSAQTFRNCSHMLNI